MIPSSICSARTTDTTYPERADCRQITDLTQKEDKFDKQTHSYVALIGFTPLNLSSSNRRSLAS